MDGHEKDIDFGIYDFGPVRTLEDYEKYEGSHLRRGNCRNIQWTEVTPNPQLSDENTISHL